MIATYSEVKWYRWNAETNEVRTLSLMSFYCSRRIYSLSVGILLWVMCRQPECWEANSVADLELEVWILHREMLRAISGRLRQRYFVVQMQEKEKTAQVSKSHQRILQIASIDVSCNLFSNTLKSFSFNVFWQEMYIYCLKWPRLLSSEPVFHKWLTLYRVNRSLPAVLQQPSTRKNFL